jgi:hypothetical protein
MRLRESISGPEKQKSRITSRSSRGRAVRAAKWLLTWGCKRDRSEVDQNASNTLPIALAAPRSVHGCCGNRAHYSQRPDDGINRFKLSIREKRFERITESIGPEAPVISAKNQPPAPQSAKSAASKPLTAADVVETIGIVRWIKSQSKSFEWQRRCHGCLTAGSTIRLQQKLRFWIVM